MNRSLWTKAFISVVSNVTLPQIRSLLNLSPNSSNRLFELSDVNIPNPIHPEQGKPDASLTSALPSDAEPQPASCDSKVPFHGCLVDDHRAQGNLCSPARGNSCSSEIRGYEYSMSGHARQCVERYCELSSKNVESLREVSTPCIDDHRLSANDDLPQGELADVASKIVLKDSILLD